MLKYKVALAVLASASIGWSVAGHAATFTGIGTAGGNSVNASATVTPGNGTLTVSITNNVVNPTDVGQDISDLEIFLGSILSGSPTYNGIQTNKTVDVASNGGFTTGTTTNTWTLSRPTSNEISLNDLGSTCGPACTVIGAPGSGGYTAANGSIAGNGAHNPFLFDTAVFNLVAPNVTASTAVTGVTFSFGTTPGVTLEGTPSSTPLPAALPLFAVGLGGLGLIGWRRKRKSRVSLLGAV